MNILRRSVVLLIVLVAPTVAADKAPKPSKEQLEACAESFERGQELRQKQELLGAREALQRCAQPHCPGALKVSCAGWLEELTPEIPRLHVGLKGEGSATVLLDGKPVGAAPVDVELNPGTHQLAARTEQGEGPVLRVEARAKQRASVELELPARPAPSPTPSPAPSTSPKSSTSVTPYALLGVGGVALGAGAWLGISAWSKARDLRGSCAPQCDLAEVDSLRSRLRFADVLLGVGAVASGVGLYMILKEDTQVSVAPQTGGMAISTRVLF